MFLKTLKIYIRTFILMNKHDLIEILNVFAFSTGIYCKTIEFSFEIVRRVFFKHFQYLRSITRHFSQFVTRSDFLDHMYIFANKCLSLDNLTVYRINHVV